MEVFHNFCVHCKCIGHLREACPLLTSIQENAPINANSLNTFDGNTNVVKDNQFNVAIPNSNLSLHVNNLVVEDVNDVTELLTIALLEGIGDHLGGGGEYCGVSVHSGTELVVVVGDDP
ncbi:hypothetical protein MA16_Dca008521 [Dendrobium catenatum]|uniref:Uncharacterized protein n=1 Tax=Dendrobium catenatum TaxID=906689 RepID=A0A2I0XHN7_9ASPA|nr:hypothetical protein MA16_Dca008521 [Dendrobium catenatum]